MQDRRPNPVNHEIMSRESMRVLLAQHGVSPTSQRLDIAEIVLERPQHLSAEQIITKVNLGKKRVSKATVYNTLRCFVEQGLLKQVHINHQHVLYDSTVEHHHHLYNEDTGELTDIQLAELPSYSLPPLPEGLEHRSIEVLVRIGESQS